MTNDYRPGRQAHTREYDRYYTDTDRHKESSSYTHDIIIVSIILVGFARCSRERGPRATRGHCVSVNARGEKSRTRRTRRYAARGGTQSDNTVVAHANRITHDDPVGTNALSAPRAYRAGGGIIHGRAEVFANTTAAAAAPTDVMSAAGFMGCTAGAAAPFSFRG